MSLMMVSSTSHWQKGVFLLLLVAGAVLVYFIVLRKSHIFPHLNGVLESKLCGVLSLFVCFLAEIYDALKYYYYIIFINANNRFAVLCDWYCSACANQRYVWCQFVADVKGSLRRGVWFPFTVKYRWLYVIAIVTVSIVAAIWRGCRTFQSCT